MGLAEESSELPRLHLRHKSSSNKLFHAQIFNDYQRPVSRSHGILCANRTTVGESRSLVVIRRFLADARGNAVGNYALIGLFVGAVAMLTAPYIGEGLNANVQDAAHANATATPGPSGSVVEGAGSDVALGTGEAWTNIAASGVTAEGGNYGEAPDYPTGGFPWNVVKGALIVGAVVVVLALGGGPLLALGAAALLATGLELGECATGNGPCSDALDPWEALARMPVDLITIATDAEARQAMIDGFTEDPWGFVYNGFKDMAEGCFGEGDSGQCMNVAASFAGPGAASRWAASKLLLRYGGTNAARVGNFLANGPIRSGRTALGSRFRARGIDNFGVEALEGGVLSSAWGRLRNRGHVDVNGTASATSGAHELGLEELGLPPPGGFKPGDVVPAENLTAAMSTAEGVLLELGWKSDLPPVSVDLFEATDAARGRPTLDGAHGNRPGWWDIDTHGAPGGTLTQGNASGTAADVYQSMLEHGYRGGPVRLLACNAATCGPMGNPAAIQELADLTGFPVVGANSTVGVGSTIEAFDGGQWMTAMPTHFADDFGFRLSDVDIEAGRRARPAFDGEAEIGMNTTVADFDSLPANQDWVRVIGVESVDDFTGIDLTDRVRPGGIAEIQTSSPATASQIAARLGEFESVARVDVVGENVIVVLQRSRQHGASLNFDQLDSWDVDISDERFPEMVFAPIAGDDIALRSTTDLPPAPRSAATPLRQVTSSIDESSRLVREAERAGRSHQASLDSLTSQLQAGNLDPGIGSRPIGGGISEARARDGARVYFREGRDGAIEILGKSNKGNQDRVINEVLRVFGD